MSFGNSSIFFLVNYENPESDPNSLPLKRNVCRTSTKKKKFYNLKKGTFDIENFFAEIKSLPEKILF